MKTKTIYLIVAILSLFVVTGFILAILQSNIGYFMAPVFVLIFTLIGIEEEEEEEEII